MRLRTTWQVYAVTLGVAGVGLSLLVHLVAMLVFVTAVMAFVGGLVCWTVADGLGRDGSHALREGVVWGTVLGAAGHGWLTTLGWGGVLVVSTAVLTHPDLVGALAHVRRRRTPPSVLVGLSDDDLRRRWQETTPRLQPSGSVRTWEDVMLIVEQRARILDEVEARDPAGFEEWIRVEAGWRA